MDDRVALESIRESTAKQTTVASEKSVATWSA
jgi:hypothetical protein